VQRSRQVADTAQSCRSEYIEDTNLIAVTFATREQSAMGLSRVQRTAQFFVLPQPRIGFISE
jgi:hypothetical protein